MIFATNLIKHLPYLGKAKEHQKLFLKNKGKIANYQKL